jgi:4-hydroxy-tetrahydrodipicolinate synthase
MLSWASTAYGAMHPNTEPDVEFAGTLPALVTPLRSPGELDLTSFAGLARDAVEAGAAGVVVAGSTGEGTLLSPADRRALTAAAVDTGVPVIAGASGATLDDLLADTERLAGTGADAVLVLAPSYQPLAPDELVDVHLAVADRCPVPTVAYHIPQFTGSALTPEVIRRLAEHPNVVAIKDSSPDAERRTALIRAAGARLALFVGHAPTIAQALRDGAAGSITAIANLRLRQVLALTDAVARGDDDEVERLQDALASCEHTLRSVPVSMAAAVKAAMQLEGTIDERWCVPPLRSVSGGQLDLVRTALLR